GGIQRIDASWGGEVHIPGLIRGQTRNGTCQRRSGKISLIALFVEKDNVGRRMQDNSISGYGDSIAV
ncbi:MAG TPA: hypothetical protein VF518_04895, partial [Polyangia bacterium]